MKVKRVRTKACDRCREQRDALYRIRIEADGPWLFCCADCVHAVKRDNPSYQYGGTWKSKKRH